MWATATSYFAQSVPDELRSTAQGILQGLHFGLGRGCGAVLGGMMITAFDSQTTFFAYGVSCLFALALFVVINYYTQDLVARQNPTYTQNEFVNEDQSDPNKQQIPEINNAVNPMMMVDTNYYYQPSANPNQNPDDSQLNTTSKSSFPIAPHGVPSVNPNWSKQFYKQ